MNVVLAIDSFKGSLSSVAAGEAAAAGIRRAFPDAACVVRPLADGGEGTVDALVAGLGGTLKTVTVTGPAGKPTQATYGLLPEGVAVMEMAQAAGILKSLKRRPLYAAGEDGYRYSAAGAQDKLVVRLKDGRLFLPLDGTPSTHIVKPGAADFPESVANELFCQCLADKLGVRAAEASVVVIGGERYYVTRRFDREVVDGRLRRLHQEDFCQMMSVDPEMKYESDGGPRFADLSMTLRRLHAVLGETLALMDMFVFNFLIGNADAHAKNYSVVYRGRRPLLAPLYDAVSTAVYPDLSRDYAMGIGGETLMGRIGRDHFARLSEECGMSPQLLLGRLDAMIERILPAARELAAELNREWPSEVYEKIVAVIGQQLKSVSSASRA